MFRSLLAMLLIGIAAPIIFPTYGEDSNSLQVQVQPTEGDGELSAQAAQADEIVCPTIAAGDTASIIDCEVNFALSASAPELSTR